MNDVLSRALHNKQDQPLVDIFIPAVSNHSHYIRAALYSAIYQTWTPTRIVLWLEDEHENFDAVLDELGWYASSDGQLTVECARDTEGVTVERTKDRVLVRNHRGRTGTASRARQWYFGWKNKAEWVKNLDADDVLLPYAVALMMRHATPGTDMVICPMVKSDSHRIGTVVHANLKRDGHAGSGAMLMSRAFMEKVHGMGFVWPNSTDGDIRFGNFVRDHFSEFKIKTMTTETAVYLYQKDIEIFPGGIIP